MAMWLKPAAATRETGSKSAARACACATGDRPIPIELLTAFAVAAAARGAAIFEQSDSAPGEDARASTSKCTPKAASYGRDRHRLHGRADRLISIIEAPRQCRRALRRGHRTVVSGVAPAGDGARACHHRYRSRRRIWFGSSKTGDWSIAGADQERPPARGKDKSRDSAHGPADVRTVATVPGHLRCGDAALRLGSAHGARPLTA